MALALEGTPVHNNATSGSSLVTSAFTTTVATEVIIVVAPNGVDVTSITGGSLTFAKRSQGGSGTNHIDLWAAPAASALSSVQFTINLAAATGHITSDVFALSGNDTATIWDANASIPASGAADPLSVSTTNANDVIIGGFRMGSQANPTQGTGFTKISGANFQLTEYQIVSATQTNLSVAIGTGVGDANGGVADAIMQASAAAGGPLAFGGALVHGGLVRGGRLAS